MVARRMADENPPFNGTVQNLRSLGFLQYLLKRAKLGQKMENSKN